MKLIVTKAWSNISAGEVTYVWEKDGEKVQTLRTFVVDKDFEDWKTEMLDHYGDDLVFDYQEPGKMIPTDLPKEVS